MNTFHSDKDKYDYFWEDVLPLLQKRLKNIDCCRSGSVMYGSFPTCTLCATPFWVDEQGINCQWSSPNGDESYGSDTIPWDVTGEPELDALRYYHIMESYIEAVERHDDERFIARLQEAMLLGEKPTH
jgi:hypothetical protein